MCLPSPKVPAPVVPPAAPRLADTTSARAQVPKATGYSSTVLTGALAPANTGKVKALGSTA